MFYLSIICILNIQITYESFGLHVKLLSSTINIFYSPLNCLVVIQLSAVHSTIKFLPAWFKTLRQLRQLKLSLRKMLRDISTQWNLNYNMLDFATKSQKVINDITGSKMASDGKVRF